MHNGQLLAGSASRYFAKTIMSTVNLQDTIMSLSLPLLPPPHLPGWASRKDMNSTNQIAFIPSAVNSYSRFDSIRGVPSGQQGPY